MAEEGFEERTEEASQRKRDEWRQEGKVAQSKELSAAILLLGITGSLYYGAGWMRNGFAQFFEASFLELTNTALQDWSIQTVQAMLLFSVKAFVFLVAPVAGAGLVLGIVSHISQFGFLWTTKPLEPDLNKLNPINALQKIFGIEGLVELFKAFIKLAVVGSVLYLLMRNWVSESGNLMDQEVTEISAYLGSRMINILFVIGLAMFVVAVGDFAFQKYRYENQIKMTRQELKEERKEVDGNPQIKARIRSLQRKFATNKMLDAVKKADVVVTNPTHIAIAIVYDRESMMAPRIVAKGADFMAQKIKEVARANGVPCVENVPLARAMYKALKIGQFISRDLYNAVAEVLAYVYRLKGRKV